MRVQAKSNAAKMRVRFEIGVEGEGEGKLSTLKRMRARWSFLEPSVADCLPHDPRKGWKPASVFGLCRYQ